MNRYIDADKLITEIDKRKEEQGITFRERNILVDIETSIARLRADMIITSLQSEVENERIRNAIEGTIRVYGKTQGEWLCGYDMDTLVIHLREAFDALEKQKRGIAITRGEMRFQVAVSCIQGILEAKLGIIGEVAPEVAVKESLRIADEFVRQWFGDSK